MAPWSFRFLLLISIIVPTVGLVLLWTRRTDVVRKILGSLLLIALGAAMLRFSGFRMSRVVGRIHSVVNSYKRERHYAELERNRAKDSSTPAVAPEPAPKSDGKTAEAARPARAPAFWTDFRGPRRDGVYDQMPVLASWPEKGLPQLWRQPSGGGYASFVVAHGKAYTIEQRRRREVVAAYNAASGRELWTHGWDAEFHEEQGDGPRATPTWEGGRIYALGATGEFRCLDAETGKRLWSRNILSENNAENLPWGMAGSPLIVDDKVIVQPGGPSGKSVIAYNKVSGQKVWSVLDDKAAYASPMLAVVAGERQILVVTDSRLVGLAPESGKLLWEYPYTSPEVNTTQPVLLGEDRIFFSSGNQHGSVVLEIEKNAGGLIAKRIWENKRMKNRFSTSVLYKGFLYGLDGGILACVDAATGDLKWKGGRYGLGQILLAGANLIVLTETGELALVAANPEKLDELAKFPAIEGKTWNYPAIAEGRLFVRNELEMACYRISAAGL